MSDILGGVTVGDFGEIHVVCPASGPKIRQEFCNDRGPKDENWQLKMEKPDEEKCSIVYFYK